MHAMIYHAPRFMSKQSEIKNSPAKVNHSYLLRLDHSWSMPQKNLQLIVVFYVGFTTVSPNLNNNYQFQVLFTDFLITISV